VVFTNVTARVRRLGGSLEAVVVPTFTSGPGTQTLPIWILNTLFRPNQAPVVNVVAVVLVAFSIVPVWLALRLSAAPRRPSPASEARGAGWVT
jgi:ABC-type spermidine/putrescine transport system permease subunit II